MQKTLDYAIMNEDNTEVVELIDGSKYKTTSFGVNSTIQERQDLGLFHVIYDKPELITNKKYGTQEVTINAEEKTVTYKTPMIDMTNGEIYNNATEQWKLDRAENVKNIVVTYDGIDYQGDEESQTRIARAVIGLPNDTTTIPWVSLDNNEHNLTKLDLQAILLDAGTQQSVIWSAGRPSVDVLENASEPQGEEPTEEPTEEPAEEPVV